MEARIIKFAARLSTAAVALVAILFGSSIATAASARSQNFLVTAATPELAEEVCVAAETFRRDLAIEWLGRELPPWQQPCPIEVTVHHQLGAGGATTFMFDRGVPFGWTMSIQGSRERVLDSVLPHEITHTIFATHFGRPLPRWADEGACTTVEHDVEKQKQDKFLIQFLTSDRGIAFNQMFAMTEYPQDIMPLYSQGYSLAKYLIQQGGKRKYVDYVGEGMKTNNWTATTRRFYGFSSLSDLQVTWLEWVRQGSPNLTAGPSEEMIAAATRESEGRDFSSRALAAGDQFDPTQSASAVAFASQYERPASPTNLAPAPGKQGPIVNNARESETVSRPVSEGWYSSKRSAQPVQAVAPPSNFQNVSTQVPASTLPVTDRYAPPAATGPIGPIEQTELTPIKAQPAARPAPQGRVLFQWQRPADQPWTGDASTQESPTEDTSNIARDNRPTTIAGSSDNRYR